MLPFSTNDGFSLRFIDALFTATSATCVTGLATVELSSNFTIFGQIIILLLIQIGGLGFMTLVSVFFIAVGHKFSLKEKVNLTDNITGGNEMNSLSSVVLSAVKLTFIVEAVGATLLTIAFTKYFPFGQALYYGIFHSISAFCNAGTDILPSNVSFALFIKDPLVLITIAVLVIIGGLGFVIISDILKKRSFKTWRLDTKIAVIMSTVLILLGTVAFMFNEYSNANTLGDLNFGYSLLNSFFHSVCMRTAGFSTVELSTMRPFARSVSIFLMFVGASPGSTGGGIKTTTFFILIAWAFNSLRFRRNTIIDKKKLGRSVLAKAATIFILAIGILTISQTLLLIFEEGKFLYEELLYEVVSAYTTVGYSLGITSSLSVGGKLVIMFNMFIGRVGTYAILSSAGNKKEQKTIKYPEIDVMM